MELGLLTLGDHRADPVTGVRTTQEERHRQLLEYLDFAAPAGFDAVIVGEHHFSDFSPESAMAAAELVLGVTVTLLAFPRHHLPRIADAYYEAWAEAGHAHKPRLTLNAHVHVAPTSQEAYDHLGIYQLPFQRWVFAKRIGGRPEDVELPPRITELDSPDSAITCGSPEEVLDRIGRLRKVCAFDRFTYQGDYGGQPWDRVMRSLDLFAGEVMPALVDMVAPTLKG